MAASKSLDDFNKLLDTSDTKVKLTVTNNLLAYLSNPENSLECEDIGLFMDAMVPWMQSSNSKVSQNSIDVLTNFADRMGTDFKPYLHMVISPVVDRLGDNKEVVREKAQLFLLKLLEREIASPYYLFEKLTLAFTHKNAKIREEVLICYQSALREHGPSNLGLSKHVPSILKLLHDPLPSVRDAAFNALTEIYRHVGEKFRQDIQRRCSAKDTKIAVLFSKFDEIKNEGGLLASACGAEDSARSFDEPDGDAGAIPKSGRQRSASFSRKNSGVGKATSPASAGAVDEEHFVKVFEEVQPATIFTARELEEELTKITDIINDPNNDWPKRVEALKKLRSVVMAGAAKHEEFFKHLRLMETPFLGVLKDLRSQVVREACCTIAFMSQHLGSKFDHFAEIILGNLINLIPNSAKVIATAGLVTVRFLIRYTHSNRLIPAIISNMESKSREIRRACCEFLELILRLWPAHTLEKQVANLQQALRKGMYDADSEARQCSRRAFWHFRLHFHENAEQILNSLDSTHKKALNLEMGMSNSNNIADQQGGRGGRLAAGSDFPRGRTVADGSPRRGSAPGPSALRSNSAIDLQAAQRAKARAQYAALARHKVGSGASLPRPGKKAADSSGMSTSVITSPERLGRTRSRMSNVSQSQPTSRSGSPSSRLSYATFSTTNRETGHDGRQRRPSGIPLSTGPSREASRETSPSRYSLNLLDRSFGSKLRGRSGHIGNVSDRQGQSRPVMAQKILQQSREAESALADALTFDSVDGNEVGSQVPLSRKAYRSFDDHSDDSETSSVCSERSLDCYRRSGDNISDIINNCASTHWNERKDGLVSLQAYFQNENRLRRVNLDGQDSDQYYKNMPSAALVEENCQIVQNVIDTLKVDDEGNAKVSEQDSKKALSQLKHLIKSGAVVRIVFSSSFLSTCSLPKKDHKGVSTLKSVCIADEVVLPIVNEIAAGEYIIGSPTVWRLKCYEVLLRVLVSQLALPHSPVKTYILNVLHDMIKDPTVRHCFNMYVELIVLRTLTAYSDPCKEVSKAAEHCISAIGKSLPPEQLINVVCPLIKTGDLPMNLGAIKILTCVIEHTTQDILEPHLKEIMESLVKAYDNEESSVRKSAVFCMVELHGIVGEAVLQPHLASLNNGKLKLLHLYIKRSHHGGSSGITSPKTTTS
ncbi:CLIP-associating protein 2-like [Schistocerca serialis cubense]|uniref:CLIP-associating protein 2-like n=1 Tax=Schistocerca serialis cubense TaxID=2023355 RepID=UPI00214DF4C0|nr:CLIP-associating protein 2-like [Schistocerca serialis cubense]